MHPSALNILARYPSQICGSSIPNTIYYTFLESILIMANVILVSIVH